MNCTTHTQGSFARALDLYLNKFKNPPLYLVEKIEKSLFDFLLSESYRVLPKDYFSALPSNMTAWEKHTKTQQIRLLTILSLQQQSSFISSFFDKTLVYDSDFHCNFSDKLLSLGISSKLINWKHFDKTLSQRNKVLLEILSVCDNCYQNDKGLGQIILGKKVFKTLSQKNLVSHPINSMKNKALGSIDLFGLRFFWQKGVCKVSIYDQQLISFLGIYRISEKSRPCQLSAWQNLPLKNIRFKYKLLKKQISSLYRGLPALAQKKVIAKISHFLKLSHLLTVSKKCKISTCRANQL